MRVFIIMLSAALYASASIGLTAPEPPAPPTPAPSPSPAPTPPRTPDEEKTMVWVTPSGKKFHKSSCRYAKSGSSVTL